MVGEPVCRGAGGFSLADLGPVLVIARREIRDQFRDWRISVPILVLTLIFPTVMNFTARQATDFVAQYGAEIIGDRLVPFLLMIVGFFPISVSLVIALESFVGEKERRSIEPLLASPLEDWQLYLGKLLAVMVPPLAASYLGIGVYLFGVQRSVGWHAPPVLLVQILTLTFVQSLVMVSAAVVISSQTTSVRAANLLASFIILPMAFLIQGESLVMFWAQYDALWWIILGLVMLALLLMRTGISHFNREELLGKEIDSLNLRWLGRLFWNRFRGQARTLGGWYREQVFPAVRRARMAILLTGLLALGGIGVGVYLSRQFVLPPEIFNLENLGGGQVRGFEWVDLLAAAGVGRVWFQNVRALFLAMLAGLISFGILAMLIVMLPFTIIGYLMASLVPAGLSPGLFLAAFVLPHGILEIPAIVLSGGGLLYMGAALAAPAGGRTLTETWVAVLADWTKIMAGLAIPLLLGAAVLEVYLTPRVAVTLVSGLLTSLR